MADARRQALEEPDVRAWRRELDVAEALAADFGERNLYTAFIADHSAVLHALVLAAETLPVRYRTENTGAEKSIALRLKRAVVNGFRFGDFAVRPAADTLRRSQRNPDAVEVSDVVAEIKRARTVQSVLRLSGASAPSPVIPKPPLSRRRIPTD